LYLFPLFAQQIIGLVAWQSNKLKQLQVKAMTYNRAFKIFAILAPIAMIVVAMSAISSAEVAGQYSGSTNSAATQSQQQIKVSIVSGASTLADKAYSPNPVNAKAGDTVTWTNDDTLFHTVTSGSPSSGGETGKAFDSGLSGTTALTTKGKTFSHKFTEKGEFPYFCQLHPTMTGKVVVS
jgi:plastocyanin